MSPAITVRAPATPAARPAPASQEQPETAPAAAEPPTPAAGVPSALVAGLAAGGALLVLGAGVGLTVRRRRAG